ncbi:MFS transporter [Cellulomonas wangsupingiae]|uniref:MFS transporter n=1 Tax=Cellulomonas wangsupingiae TaxID=2968085 RepID=A0ABY5KBJ2_9CELL|nr:MFS transporter [Cellulomonas wangsupingiae]MCC2334706.1 MFS transporter [Cellulomonas wangsupingiae]MCM0638573.1 MFS transporter [Cellulomonas wangsupingiae]UUI66336.1 MFS transporter [Cellulomonas wangsupingiae]
MTAGTLAPAVPRRTAVGYALGSVGTGGFGTLPGLVLAYYLTDTLGVAAGLAGLVVTVPKIWDVVIDPFIGARSDASVARHGSRRRFLLAGALCLPLLFAALFATPAALTGRAAAAWVVVTFVAAATAFSLFQVPYIALPAEIAPTSAARTRLLAPRVAVLAVAILAFGGGGPLLRDAAGGGRPGYVLMGVVCGLVIGAGMLATWFTAPRQSLLASSDPGVTPAAPRPARRGDALRSGLTAVREVPAFRSLLATFVLQALATGAMLAAAQYVATYTLGSQAAVTLLFVALVAPALLVMPLATRLAQRVGKQRALVTASVLFAVAAALLVPAGAAPGAWVYGPVALAGIAYAGMQLYPLAMLPDVAAVDARERGVDRAGVLSGVWTAGETAGLALGPTLVLGVLAVTGFVSSTGDEVVTQPGSALTGIVVAFSLLPAVLVALSLVPLSRYRLSAADVDHPERTR